MGGISILVTGLERVVAKLGPHGGDRAVAAALESTAAYAADLVRAKTPVKTGMLRNSIEGKVRGNKKAVVGSALHYASFVEGGTGIHGPNKRAFGPKHAKVMVWMPVTKTGAPVKGSAKVVARSVDGQVARQMFHKTFQQDRAKIRAHFQREFMKRYRAG